MALFLLTKLSRFSRANPKMVMLIVIGIAIAAFGIHYKMLVGERDKLRVAEQAYEAAVTAFELREATLQEDIRLAAAATAQLSADRDADRRALDTLRAGREADIEAQEWAIQQLPVGEIVRLCAALPEMVGCE